MSLADAAKPVIDVNVLVEDATDEESYLPAQDYADAKTPVVQEVMRRVDASG